MKRHPSGKPPPKKRRREFARHLVLFTRAPRLGRVKRRLAASLGAVAALRFHRAAMATTLARFGRHPSFRLWLAVTPDDAGGIANAWPRAKGVARLRQGPGDLGRRMGRVVRVLPPGPVVIVGSDIPEARVGDVRDAFRALTRFDAVFGAAGDGGYWLVGFRRVVLPFCPFRDVRWSSAHALQDTLRNLGPCSRVARVATREDVDDERSFRRWREREKRKRP